MRDEHFTSFSIKTAWTIYFKLCTYFKQDAEQKRTRVFSKNEEFIFYFNSFTSFERIL